MSDIDRVEVPKYSFFDKRKFPGPQDCDRMAQAVTQANFVRPVDSPSSRSYTVICSGCPIEPLDRVVTFIDASLDADDRIYALANKAHIDLAPCSDWKGDVPKSDPPLVMHWMYLREGQSLMSLRVCHSQLNERQTKRQLMIMEGFANYFGRVYKTAKKRSKDSLSPQLAFTRERLLEFKDEGILPDRTMDKLISAVPTLFSDTYRQGITNCNLSQTNVRIDPQTYEISGIVDWSCARILPFGTEMDILFEFTGFKDFGKWSNYVCKHQCIWVFWDRFWISSGIGTGITGISQRSQVRELAMTAAKINAILRLGFRRNKKGWPAGEFSCSLADREQLRAWFRGWS